MKTMSRKTKPSTNITSRNSGIPTIWRKVAGMLKGKKHIDPVTYQRRIRAESDRRLTKRS